MLETIQDQLRKYESLLTCECTWVILKEGLTVVTPQRMRMIVHAFEDTLDKGLKKDGQVVVSPLSLLHVGSADDSQ